MKCPKCESEKTTTIMTPELTHWAKSICQDCGAFIKWMPYPGNSGGPFDHLLIEQGDGDYEVNFGKHKGEMLSAAMVDDGQYFLDFVLEEFPDNVCDAILDCADKFSIILSP